jgi:hypothetical protein
MVDAHPPDGARARRPADPAPTARRPPNGLRLLAVVAALAAWLLGAVFAVATIGIPEAGAVSQATVGDGVRPAIEASLASVGGVVSAAAGPEHDALRAALPLTVGGAASAIAPAAPTPGTAEVVGGAGDGGNLVTGGGLPILAGLALLGVAARMLVADRARGTRPAARPSLTDSGPPTAPAGGSRKAPVGGPPADRKRSAGAREDAPPAAGPAPPGAS